MSSSGMHGRRLAPGTFQSRLCSLRNGCALSPPGRSRACLFLRSLVNAGGRACKRAMHRLVAVQTATLTPKDLALPQEGARHWQAEKAAQVAFWATALFAAQLYLSPALWIPFLEPLRPAAVLSVIALSALLVRRMLKNEPLWMGWRTALLAVYAGTALLSPIWSLAPAASVDGALEVAKHFLFFLAVINSVNTPRRVRLALGLYALSAIAPGWGTFDNWRHDLLLVEGFRGRWLGVLADPNHDAMALVGAVPILLFLALGRGHSWMLRVAAMIGVAACLAGIVATHSRGGFDRPVVRGGGLRAALQAQGAGVDAGDGVGGRSPAARAHIVLGSQRDGGTRAPRTSRSRAASRPGRWRSASSTNGRSWASESTRSSTPGGRTRPSIPTASSGSDSVAHNLILEVLGQLGLVGLFGLVGFMGCAIWSAWRARNGVLGGEARAVLAALLGYLVCQMFSGYSMSWFLFALCGFATCCDAWAPRREPAVDPPH